jgi:hypothetical protein
MNRKLRTVEALPTTEANSVLALKGKPLEEDEAGTVDRE